MSARVFKLSGLTLFVALALTHPAHAAKMTQTVNLGYVATNVDSLFSFNQFDPSLGTLTSVVATFNGDFQNSFGFINLGSGTNAEFEFIQKAMLQGPDNTVIYNSGKIPNTFQGMVALGGSSLNNLSMGGGPSSLRPLGLKSFGGSHAWNQMSELALFSGGGMVNLPFAASAVYLSRVGNGFADVLGQTKVSALTELTYNFTPTAIPEPETYLMLLAGLGVTWLRFRRADGKKTTQAI